MNDLVHLRRSAAVLRCATGNLGQEDPDLWEFLFKINVATAVLSCRSAVPFMLQQRRGCIINVASRDAVAEVIVFLASDQARAISGAAIPVFGKG